VSVRLKEKLDLEIDINERTQIHLEKIRTIERADSAERNARNREDKTWYKARINIQESSQ